MRLLLAFEDAVAPAVIGLGHSGQLPTVGTKGVEALVIKTFIFGFVFPSPGRLALIGPANAHEREQKHGGDKQFVSHGATLRFWPWDGNSQSYTRDFMSTDNLRRLTRACLIAMAALIVLISSGVLTD